MNMAPHTLKPLVRCPMCGSRRISRREITVPIRRGTAECRVEADICRQCGEGFLDSTAARKISRQGRSK